jgi:hypothetical protein
MSELPELVNYSSAILSRIWVYTVTLATQSYNHQKINLKRNRK